MQQWYQCPNCGAPVNFGIKFCGKCGEKLNWPKQPQPQPLSQHNCPRCGALISAGTHFCHSCGMSLSQPNHQQTHISSQRDNVSHSRSSPMAKFLKKTGISILGLLLFLSLSVFGIAFLVNQTILNPGFVTSEVNRFELASLANDFITTQLSDDFSTEISSAVSKTIDKLEPQLKAELSTAIYTVYDYLLGKRESLNLSTALRSTFLSSDFLAGIIEELDVASLVKPIMHEQVANWIPEQMSFLSSYIYPSLDKVLVNQEPWIKEQLKAAADPIADYLVGKRQNFNVTISTKPVIDDLKKTLLADITELLIPNLPGIPLKLIEPTLNQLFSQVIPESIDIDQTIIGKEAPEQIKASLAELEDTLEQIKEYIGYFQLGYILLIIFMVLLVIGIALIYREVKGAGRTLGIIFLVYGVIELSSLLFARNYLSQQVEQLTSDVPAQLQLWLQQFLNNVSYPLQILSIGFIVGGIVLIVVSFVYKPQRAMK